ncbi:MAG: ATP-binding cassette domain-containing protein [Bdellovibrionales bacterium]|nr:ATP-binding cassette domain-containing protein [Bdellovibrionales bacterium]
MIEFGSLDFLGLEKIYDSTKTGLAPFNASIPESQWVALLGPSGSGKSTLLKLISELEPASGGTFHTPYARDQIGFVFQESALLPWLTVMENIMLPITIRGAANCETEARKRAKPWIEKLRLQNFLDAYPRELSGGMKMRVSIARALITEPKLLLLDEPFSALDEPIRMELGLELRELWKQLKPTVFMVTHSITEALWLADRAIVLHGQPGKIVLDEKLPFGHERPLSLRGSQDFQSRVEKCFELLKPRDGAK